METHYCRIEKSDEVGVVQIESKLVGNKYTYLPMSIIRLAHKEYQNQGHRQSLERIQARGGFGVLEIVDLLADLAQRTEEPNQ